MDLWETIAARHSVRQFDPAREVTPAEVQTLLEAAIRAPSAGNRQPWHFCVVRDSQMRGHLAEAAYGQQFVAQAPVVIAVCAVPQRSAERYHDRGRELYCLQDTAAVEHILLGAVALGLGSCWVGAFNEAAAAEALGLDPALRPVALLPIGKPAGSPARRPRLPLEQVVTYYE